MITGFKPITPKKTLAAPTKRTKKDALKPRKTDKHMSGAPSTERGGKCKRNDTGSKIVAPPEVSLMSSYRLFYSDVGSLQKKHQGSDEGKENRKGSTNVKYTVSLSIRS